MNKIAVIDIGTNTFHLLIVAVENGEKKVIFKEKIAVKLGEGGISESRITDDAQKRALNTLSLFQSIIEKEKVDKVFASATSAMRNASNGNDLMEQVLEKTGIKINLITGLQEAKLIQKGVKAAIQLDSKPTLIMDIGGGSVEFIICNSSEIFWLESFEIGAQRLLDKFHKHDPISPEDIDHLNSYLETQLLPLMQQMAKWEPHDLIGSSGTFDTLVDIAYEKQGKEKPEDISYLLTLEDFNLIYDEIIHKNKMERLAIPGMLEMRVDMIVVAVCLIRFILRNNEFDVIQVSTYALKEGVLQAIIDKEIF